MVLVSLLNDSSGQGQGGSRRQLVGGSVLPSAEGKAVEWLKLAQGRSDWPPAYCGGFDVAAQQGQRVILLRLCLEGLRVLERWVRRLVGAVVGRGLLAALALSASASRGRVDPIRSGFRGAVWFLLGDFFVVVGGVRVEAVW